MGKVPLESQLVHALFKCTLCNGLIRSATAIDECLHRFCKICITKHFENTDETKCPTCHETVAHPLESLKPDPTFQRLLYKLFPSVFQREINYKPSLLSSAIANESPRIHFDSNIDVHLDYWDLSSDLFPNSNSSTVTLPSCYLECIASTPLKLIEKFIRLRYSLPSDLQIDLFYERFLLDKENERLIDICYCFDQITKNQTIHLRFLVSPFGYEAILKRIRQSRQPLPETTPLQIEITEKSSRSSTTVDPSASPSASSCDSTSIDPKLKVKIRRSDTSNNNWYIPTTNASAAATIVTPKTALAAVTVATTTTANTTNEPVGLPDLVNSCEQSEKIVKRKGDPPPLTSSSTTPKKKPCTTSTFFSPGHVSQPSRTSILKPRSKPRRRTRFIPTMVQAPPSIFDRLRMNQFDYSDPDSDTSPICSSTDFIDQSTVTTMRPAEMVIVNVEGNVSDPFDTRKISGKTICKVPPYIPEPTTINNSPPEKPPTTIIKPTAIYPTISPNRRAMLPKRSPSLIPPVNSRLTTSMNDTTESAPLDLSCK